MSKQTEAIEMLFNHSLFRDLLEPVFDRKRENLNFHEISYGVLSGGQKAALSWAFAIWNDKMPPNEKMPEAEWKEWPGFPMRDPFDGFGIMDRELQVLVLKAYLHRWS